MTNTGGQERARRAVLQRMAEHEPRLSLSSLAQKARVHRDTIRKFLAGQWPQQATRSAIELALGWEQGTLERIAAGQDAPAEQVPDAPADLIGWPDGLVDGMPSQVRQLWEAEVRAYAMRRALELKGEL